MESRSVSIATLRDYYRRALEFLKWASARYPSLQEGDHFLRDAGKHRYDDPRPLWLVRPEVLGELVIYFDLLFMQRRPAAQGEKLVAALIFFFPSLMQGGSAPLGRAVRGLKGWRRAVPPQSRLPLPMTALLAIVDEFITNDWEVAIATILAFHCYLRPCEAESLTPAQVVAAPDPQGSGRMKIGLVLAPSELRMPSKTGNWDEALLIERCDAIVVPLLAMKLKAATEESMHFSFKQEAMTPKIRAAAESLGLAEFNISAYSLRHGGASHDLLC